MLVSLIKKVLLTSTFFVCAYAYSCPPSGKVEKATVKWVYDGDTLKLADGRKVRIIGIDTPETSHHKRKAEAYAGQATEELRALLVKSHYQIKLQMGKQRHDKYRRHLAHVFTPDNTNISEFMLEKGLATFLVIPPNNRYTQCYASAEQKAQSKRLNIWKQTAFSIQEAASLKASRKGYIRLRGTVQKIKRRKNKITIELEKKIYITIKKPDLVNFKVLKAPNLKGRIIIVTGMLYKHGKKRHIRIRDPHYLKLE